MIYIIILGIVVVFLVVIKLVTNGLTEYVDYAFVEDPTGEGKTIAIKKGRNKMIYIEGGKVVDLSGYDKYIVSGPSMEKVGLQNGSYIYTKDLKDDEPIESICNHFVVFKFDKKRFSKEHPKNKVPIDGYKVRKAIAFLPTKLSEEAFIAKMSKILNKDKEILDKKKYVYSLYEKYKFASEFYKDEDELIVSFTYRKGIVKDYSFEPAILIKSVVKFKSDN